MGAAMSQGAMTGVLPPVRPAATAGGHASGDAAAAAATLKPALPALHHLLIGLLLPVALQDEPAKGQEAKEGPSAVQGAQKMAEGAAEVATAAGQAAAATAKAAADTAGAAQLVVSSHLSERL